MFYNKNDYRNYLMHYGVKGMRWGRTRKGSSVFDPRPDHGDPDEVKTEGKSGLSGSDPHSIQRPRNIVGRHAHDQHPQDRAEELAEYKDAIRRRRQGMSRTDRLLREKSIRDQQLSLKADRQARAQERRNIYDHDRSDKAADRRQEILERRARRRRAQMRR